MKESKGIGVRLINQDTQKGGKNETESLYLFIGNGIDGCVGADEEDQEGDHP